MSNDYQPDHEFHPASRRELWISKVVLLIIVLGLCVVGKRAAIHTLAPSDLIPMDRASSADKSLAYAFNNSDHLSRDADRVYLANLVKRALSDVDVETIQGWRVCWKVDPLAVPPLNRNQPVTETMLDSFTASLQASKPKGER